MNVLRNLFIPVFLLTSCKTFNSNVSEPTSLDVHIKEINLEISEDDFKSKKLDGPNGESVKTSDFLFYLVEAGATTLEGAEFTNGIVSNKFTNVNFNQAYDIYASTIHCPEIGEISANRTFPTQSFYGEFYQGKITTEPLKVGENFITIPIQLQTFYLDVDFSSSQAALNALFGNNMYYITATQNGVELKWDTSTTTPMYGLPIDGSIEVTLYQRTPLGKNFALKTVLIEDPQVGKRYIVIPDANMSVSSSVGIYITTDWDNTETSISL